jgi:uncharacterized membrane protein
VKDRNLILFLAIGIIIGAIMYHPAIGIVLGVIVGLAMDARARKQDRAG